MSKQYIIDMLIIAMSRPPKSKKRNRRANSISTSMSARKSTTKSPTLKKTSQSNGTSRYHRRTRSQVGAVKTKKKVQTRSSSPSDFNIMQSYFERNSAPLNESTESVPKDAPFAQHMSLAEAAELDINHCIDFQPTMDFRLRPRSRTSKTRVV